MKIKKLGALLVSAALCAGMAAPAFAFEGEAAPVEQPVLPEVVEEDVVTITDETSGALTPEGNLTLVDDYHTNYSDGSGQQFITLVSKSGATFYLVIDRNAKGQQTVHFMNLVDEADLLALMEEDAADAYTAEKEAAAQAEQDKLKAEEEAKKAAEEAAACAMKEKRDETIILRLSKTEKNRIYEKMLSMGIRSLSAYIRKMALDGYCLNLDLPQLRRMAYLLQMCSNNLNQYAKAANENGRVYAADMEDLRQRLDELIDIGKQILSKLAEL